jgi:hypothetical protein
MGARPVFSTLGMRRSLALRLVWFGVRSRKLSNVGHRMGDQYFFFLVLFCASEGTLSRWSRQQLAATNQHWARVVGYGPFSLCVHKEGLCPSSGDINRLMMRNAITEVSYRKCFLLSLRWRWAFHLSRMQYSS